MIWAVSYVTTLVVSSAGGAVTTYLVLRGRICPDTDAHELTDVDRSEITGRFKKHASAVRAQVSGYADLLAGGDPELRERLRLLEAGDH